MMVESGFREWNLCEMHMEEDEEKPATVEVYRSTVDIEDDKIWPSDLEWSKVDTCLCSWCFDG